MSNIKLPRVTLTPGVVVTCSSAMCGGGGRPIAIAANEAVAEEAKTAHLEYHQQHTERINRVLGKGPRLVLDRDTIMQQVASKTGLPVRTADGTYAGTADAVVEDGKVTVTAEITNPNISAVITEHGLQGFSIGYEAAREAKSVSFAEPEGRTYGTDAEASCGE